MNEHTTRFEIAKLELRPDDRLVVKVKSILSREQISYIEQHFQRMVGDEVGIIVMGEGVELEVLRPS